MNKPRKPRRKLLAFDDLLTYIIVAQRKGLRQFELLPNGVDHLTGWDMRH